MLNKTKPSRPKPKIRPQDLWIKAEATMSANHCTILSRHKERLPLARCWTFGSSNAGTYLV